MIIKKSSPIGVFDSGVGGLSVVKEMLKQMPNESFVYYADTAHVPYGSKQPEQIIEYTSDITDFLLQKGCKMIIIACNTTNSLAYDSLISEFEDVPFVGVIEPGVDKALETTKNGKIGIIATVATAESEVYQDMITEKNPCVQAFAEACPLFVPFVEKGQTDGDEVRSAAEGYLQPLLDSGIDTLIMGCTHYPFLLPLIEEITGPGVTSVDPAKETVKRAIERLKEEDLCAEENPKPFRRFFVSGDPEAFARVAAKFIDQKLEYVEKVVLTLS